MSAIALKEWASVIAAMLDGAQVVMLRKGGVGEKRFDVPHREFLLLPTHVHQRPELLVPAARDAYADLIGVTDEPDRVDLRAWCRVAAVHEVTTQAELDALAPYHVLGPGYAGQRLRWRPRHPLMAIVARVHRITPPVGLDVTGDMRGCRSWIEVVHDLPGEDPVIDDDAFAEVMGGVADALAAARPMPGEHADALG